MSRYKYNDLTLPALPEWDKETYPYALIFLQMYGGESVYDTSPESGIVLIVANKLGYLDDPRGITNEALETDTYVYTMGGNDWDGFTPDPIDYIRWTCPSLEEGWQEFDTGSRSQIDAGMKSCYPDMLAWTNTTLYDADGNVVLEASDPIPICDLRSWLTGFALGFSGKPLPLSTGKKLVGYSYNGTVLPKLPEWDREMYPYAFMLDKPSLYLCSSLPCAAVQTVLSPGYMGIFATGDCDVIRYEPTTDGGSWQRVSETAESFSTSEMIIGLAFFDLLWTNTDIINTEDRTVFLAASEPIPVYE